MREEFEHPSRILPEVNKFLRREPGLTHPDMPSFMRLRDNGDIEIMAAEGLGIVLNARTMSITLVADHIKFMTRHEDGLRWNDVSFNDRAVSFNEPTFIRFNKETSINRSFNDVNYYTKKDPSTEKSHSDKFAEAIAQRYGDKSGE